MTPRAKKLPLAESPPSRALQPLTPTEVRFQRRHLRHNARNSLWDGLGFSFMVGLGETYLPAFVLALGMGEINSGLIAAVPLMAGAFFQLISPFAVQLLGSYRKWVVCCASLQCFIFLPLTLAAYTQKLPISAAFLLASLYWGAGMGAGPAWNGWMSRLISTPVRTHFFARRTRLTQIGTLIGFVGGGAYLHWVPQGAKTQAFGALFLLAFVARLFSVFRLAAQKEDDTCLSRYRPPSFRFLGETLLGNRAALNLFLFVFVLQFGVYFSAPFFTPFMLEQIRLDYFDYMTLVAVSYVAKIAFLPTMAAVAKLHGTRTLMWIAGFGVVCLPLGWALSTHFYFLMGLQVVSGFFWSAFDLAFPLLVMESIPEKDRMNTLVLHNFCQSAVIVAAAMLGATLLDGLGRDWGAYTTLFIASTFLRALAVPFLRHLPIPHWRAGLSWRTVGIRPGAGTLLVPIFDSIRPRKRKSHSRKPKRSKAA